jgi:hypothetical protein
MAKGDAAIESTISWVLGWRCGVGGNTERPDDRREMLEN